MPLALGLFAVIRPLSTLFFLVNSPTRMSQRWLMGWFGIRGIGSLYYMGYSLNHGLSFDRAKHSKTRRTLRPGPEPIR